MMNKVLNKVIILALIVLAIVLVIVFANNDTSEESSIDVVEVQAQLTEISYLTTAEYNYTTMSQYEDYTEFYGYKIPFTTNKFIISFDGTILAGTDLAEAVVEESEGVITVTLQHCEIISHEIDFDNMQIIDETYSVFNKLVISDYTAFQQEQSSVMETKAIDSGLLEKADENAESFITLFLTSAYPEAEVVVEFAD